MKFDKDKVDEYTLALLYLIMWEEKHYGPRVWKGFDWDTMDRLCEKGFIHDPKSKSKSVAVTEKGFEKAKELFQKFFVEGNEYHSPSANKSLHMGRKGRRPLRPVSSDVRGIKAERKLLKEKEAIEKATADAFIELYNEEMRTTFCITEYSDAPDIRCKDSDGNIFNFEITLTEDRPKDIQAALGRSDHRSLESLRKHLADVRAGKASPLDRVSCLQENVSEMIISRIQPKLNKDYGFNTALVIRDTSPVSWDWDLVVDDIKSALNLERNPFDKGIWILTFRKDKIYRIL